jgi:SAM-dependent methyltransferase
LSDRGADRPSRSYFESAYRDYERQNPRRKLDHYLDSIAGSSPRPGLKLLDIGCGRGSFLEHVASLHPEWVLYGIDKDPSAIAWVERVVPRAVVRTGSTEVLSSHGGSFDVITAWDVLEHVEDLVRVRQEIESRLMPGGTFAFVVPVYDGVLGALVEWLDRDPTHIHKLSRAQWLRWAELSFDSVRWQGIFRYLLPGGPYVHIRSTRLRDSAPAILVTARKREIPSGPPGHSSRS